MKRNQLLLSALIGMCAFGGSIKRNPDSGEGNGGSVEGTTATDTVEEKEVESSDKVIGTHEGLEFTRQEFKLSRKSGQKSILTGWGFAAPKFASVSQMVEHYNKLCIAQDKKELNGEKIVLDLAQGSLEGKLRIRVKASVPDFKSDANAEANYFEDKAKNNESKTLFSIEEAYNWIPGVREMSERKQLEARMAEVVELLKTKSPMDPDIQKMLADIALGFARVNAAKASA